MKKLISIISLSLILLTSSAMLVNSTIKQNTIILHVNSSILDPNTNFYIAEVLDENGDIYIIQSYDDISNHWLDATINTNYEITDYKIMD